MKRKGLTLRLGPEAKGIVENAENDLVLGIIRSDGEVRLTIADRQRVPGHLEWLKAMRWQPDDVIRGFSLIVRQGKVHRLFRRSRLNRPDTMLERVFLRQLENLLPLEENYLSFEG